MNYINLRDKSIFVLKEILDQHCSNNMCPNQCKDCIDVDICNAAFHLVAIVNNKTDDNTIFYDPYALKEEI